MGTLCRVWNLVSGEHKEVKMPDEACFGEMDSILHPDEIRRLTRSVAKALAGWGDLSDEKIAVYINGGELENVQDVKEELVGERIRLVNVETGENSWCDSGKVSVCPPEGEILSLKDEGALHARLLIRDIVNWSEVPDENVVVILPDGAELERPGKPDRPGFWIVNKQTGEELPFKIGHIKWRKGIVPTNRDFAVAVLTFACSTAGCIEGWEEVSADDIDVLINGRSVRELL